MGRVKWKKQKKMLIKLDDEMMRTEKNNGAIVKIENETDKCYKQVF